MKTSFVLAALASIAAAGTINARAASYAGFPKSLTCENSDGTKITVTAAEAQAAALSAITSKKATVINAKSASDQATVHCQGVKDPLYSASLKTMGFRFAYGTATGKYTYCDSQAGKSIGGYPDHCKEN